MHASCDYSYWTEIHGGLQVSFCSSDLNDNSTAGVEAEASDALCEESSSGDAKLETVKVKISN